MAHYSFVKPDRIIVKDGIAYQMPSDDVWLNDYTSIHAIQINDTSGEVEPVSGDNRSATSDEIKAVTDKWTALKSADDKAKLDAEEAWLNNWVRVRQVRTLLLSETDWTVMSDSPLDDSKKTEYINYRKSLRDIPSTYSGNNAKDITFSEGNVSVSGTKKISKPS
tara:strand:- start:2290 stop:2784 length:495 start_codon:yes stop_codon:yes gene_type:complete